MIALVTGPTDRLWQLKPSRNKLDTGSKALVAEWRQTPAASFEDPVGRLFHVVVCNKAKFYNVIY